MRRLHPPGTRCWAVVCAALGVVTASSHAPAPQWDGGIRAEPDASRSAIGMVAPGAVYASTPCASFSEASRWASESSTCESVWPSDQVPDFWLQSLTGLATRPSANLAFGAAGVFFSVEEHLDTEELRVVQWARE